MEKTFSKEQVEKFIEQAYLNGIAVAALSNMRTGSYVEDIYYKNSTAYKDFIGEIKLYF